MLHVTNGATAARLIEQAVDGEVLPWPELLHDGPVPAAAPSELTKVRARFLAEGWPTGYERELKRLAERDRLLDEATHVVLWFEHDLFDQLLLIQVLERLNEREAELVQANRYLGELSAEEVAELWPTRCPVTKRQRETARRAWSAFTNGDLAALAEVRDLQLPFLAPALRRLLQELPWTSDGLSRTERHVLEAVAAGAVDRDAIFARVSAREDPYFLGDEAVWRVLDRLTPLAVTPQLELTDLGRAARR